MARVLPLVVSNGLCVGCGACQAAAPDAVEVRLQESGTYLPVRRDGGEVAHDADDLPDIVDAVCPFSTEALDEDTLASRQYAGLAHHEAIGYYRTIVAGHVSNGDFRALGTSGGMTSWVLHQLLESGHVDAVVHVASTDARTAGVYSDYTISRSPAELLRGRKSRYHVQTMAHVLSEVRDVPGRYAFVGVPCFIKAIRLLASHDEHFAERVTFTASLVCGHLKSRLFSEYLAWSMGVPPEEVAEIDYRHKQPGRPANRYAVRIRTWDGEERVRGVEDIPMSDWGIGLFKLKSCDYCDDVVGETADISLGDAWLPPLMSDWRGANLAIARSETAAALLSEGAARGDLALIPWTAEQAAASQEAGLRHRRAGLAVRLADRQRRGLWVPSKRVAPAPPDELDSKFAERMLTRQAIAEASGPAFLAARARGDLGSFTKTMAPLVRRYHGSTTKTRLLSAARWVLVRLPAPVERLVRRVTGGRRWT